MPTRLHSIVIDCDDHVAQGRWWASALGWTVAHADGGEVVVEAPDGADTQPSLVFGTVPDRTPGKNRVHLDLSSTSTSDQHATVERLQAQGARRADVGQTDVSWIVLADPEGNEFCVLAPDRRFHRPGALAAVVIDAVDPPSLARFWSAAIGWRITATSHLLASLQHPSDMPPALLIISVPDPTARKNQVHIDLAPGADDDQQAEVDRLVQLGARTVDIGQGDVPWAVLADPEGHEFCVLTPR